MNHLTTTDKLETTWHYGIGTTTIRLTRLPRDMASDALALDVLLASRGAADTIVVR